MSVGKEPFHRMMLIGLLNKLTNISGQIECIYAAGPWAYPLYRQNMASGLNCKASPEFRPVIFRKLTCDVLSIDVR